MKLNRETKLTINHLTVTKCGKIGDTTIYTTSFNDTLYLVDENDEVTGSILLIDVSPNEVVVTDYKEQAMTSTPQTNTGNNK